MREFNKNDEIYNKLIKTEMFFIFNIQDSRLQSLLILSFRFHCIWIWKLTYPEQPNDLGGIDLFLPLATRCHFPGAI